MGLFDKIVGKIASGESPLNVLKEAAEEAASQLGVNNKPAAQTPQQPAPRPAEPAAEDDEIPKEENQYNSGLTYTQYFEKIFREDFSAYTVTPVPDKDTRNKVYAFFSGGRKVLVVELKTERSEAQRIRRAAQAEGVPYLRFYYDHEGWWNLRTYVVNRISAALNG
jgi:hypothetical protein